MVRPAHSFITNLCAKRRENRYKQTVAEEFLLQIKRFSFMVFEFSRFQQSLILNLTIPLLIGWNCNKVALIAMRYLVEKNDPQSKAAINVSLWIYLLIGAYEVVRPLNSKEQRINRERRSVLCSLLVILTRLCTFD